MTAGNLAHDEERRLDVPAGQLVEQPTGRRLQSPTVVRPQRRVDGQSGGRLDAEVLFDVETQDDLHGSSAHLPRRSFSSWWSVEAWPARFGPWPTSPLWLQGLECLTVGCATAVIAVAHPRM